MTTHGHAPSITNVSVNLTLSGPELTWPAGFTDWRTMNSVAHALLDGSRAVRAGDDPAEVALAEWTRRNR